MNVSSMVIKQVNNKASLVAVVSYTDQRHKEIVLATAPKASMLQKPYMHFIHDTESLHAEIDYQFSMHA